MSNSLLARYDLPFVSLAINCKSSKFTLDITLSLKFVKVPPSLVPIPIVLTVI